MNTESTKKNSRQGSRIIVLTLSSTIAVLGMIALTGAASVAQAAAPTTHQACYYNVETQEYGCTTVTEASQENSAATGRIPAAQLMAAGVTPSATYLLARMYENVNYNALPGGTIDFTGSSTYCTNTWSGEFATAWQKKVSSYHSYGNCRTALFSKSHQGGAVYGPLVDASRVGALNDASLSYRLEK